MSGARPPRQMAPVSTPQILAPQGRRAPRVTEATQLTAPIFLMGFMGCGKSAVARSLARSLRAPWIDLDARVEFETGQSIAEIFAVRGEPAFRALETEQLALAARERAIVSLGGGAPTQAANRELLCDAARDGALIVYLCASEETLARRIRRTPGKRPLIDGQGELDLATTRARVRELLTIRDPIYRAIATHVITTDGLAISEVAAHIQQLTLQPAQN